MADLNADDSWFLADPRRGKLIALVGDEYRADGMAMAAWRLARRFWKDGRKLIPEDLWDLAGLEPLIGAKLASRTPDGIYVAGTKQRCAYVFTKAEAGHIGGVKSAEARAEKFGSSQPGTPKQAEAASKQPEAPGSDAKQSKLSEAFTLLSCASALKEEITEPSAPKAPRPRKPPSEGARLWEPYRQAYEARHKHEPVRNAKVNAHLKQLAERLGVETGTAVLKFFYACEDDWLVKRAHPLGKLVLEAEEWRAKMLSRQGASARHDPKNPFLTVEDIRAGR